MIILCILKISWDSGVHSGLKGQNVIKQYNA